MPAKKSAKKSTAKKPAAKKAASRKAAPKKAAPKKAAQMPGADWRAESLDRMRRLIREAVPGVVEEAKWRKPSNPDGVPTWSSDGLICTGETYKDYVKLTFMHGAMLKDPARLFNAGFGGGTRRAIDIRAGEEVDAAAFKALVRDAADRNKAVARG